MGTQEEPTPHKETSLTVEVLTTTEELAKGVELELPDGDKRVRVIIVPRPFGFSG
ncbi:MAG: hypothetical protein KA712_20475 [Myxococcales bacterium]|nr:hypothetical protein [Myxococcales bacterium]